jgi:hypothetical protein
MRAWSLCFYRYAMLCAALFAFAEAGVASEASHRVKVTILRRESSIHSSISNRDEYVVRIQPKSGKRFVARIVDQYPGYSDAPLIGAGKDGVLLSVSLRRAPYCDSDMNPEYGLESMKCFEVVHDSWRLPKNADDWWK